MRVLPYGDRAVLIELDDGEDGLGLQAQLTGTDGIDELIPAAVTLLVQFDPTRLDAARVRQLITAGARRPVTDSAKAPLVLPVSYDGVDLDAVAAEARCSVEDVIARHSGAIYTVAFCGFSPGFGYLRGLDPSLQLPRLATPRTEVPAGSIAVAGEFTGVYPRASPGGWRLLGHTDSVLWDASRTPPALLAPGVRVRFELT
jgi:KipI family sensor histidine kinase inhibitor